MLLSFSTHVVNRTGVTVGGSHNGTYCTISQEYLLDDTFNFWFREGYMLSTQVTVYHACFIDKLMLLRAHLLSLEALFLVLSCHLILPVI